MHEELYSQELSGSFLITVVPGTGIMVTEVLSGGKNPGSEHPAEKEEKPVALIPPERLHEYYQTRQVISSELHPRLGKEWL